MTDFNVRYRVNLSICRDPQLTLNPSLLVYAQVLGANLETLAGVLEVEVNMVLELVIRQPTLLATQAANIATAMDTLATGLKVG